MLRFLFFLLIAVVEIRSHYRPCYEPLCDVVTGYYIQSVDQTDIFVDELVHPNASHVCIRYDSERNDLESYCTTIQHPAPRILSIPGILRNLTTIDIVLHNDLSSKEIIIRRSYAYVRLKELPRFICRVQVRYPQYGGITSDVLNVSMLADEIGFHTAKRIEFNVLGISTLTLGPKTNTLVTVGIQPGTWFYTASLIFDEKLPLSSEGYPTYGHVEYVASPEVIARDRRFWGGWKLGMIKTVADKIAKPTSFLVDMIGAVTQKQGVSAPSHPIHVCIWSSNHIDGQRTIWLQQIQSLRLPQFRFSIILTNDIENQGQGTLRFAIFNSAKSRSMDHVQLVQSPLTSLSFTSEDVQEAPPDGPALRSGDSAHTAHTGAGAGVEESDPYRYAAERLRKVHYDIERLTPSWVRTLFLTMKNSMVELGCDVIVYGNTKGFSGDVLIRDTARAVGLPSVSELTSIHLDGDMLPDVVVAPSTFAIEHDSVYGEVTRATVRNDSNSSGSANVTTAGGMRPVRLIVIAPGVDESMFSRSAVRDPIQPHRDCVAIVAANSRVRGSVPPINPSTTHNGLRCFVVGFVARLAPGKSPGLFLMAAHLLLQTHPHARFTVVGEGELRESLEAMAVRLDIDWAVKFVGWASQQRLPRLLAGMDVVVSFFVFIGRCICGFT